jgi:hypothetical protein
VRRRDCVGPGRGLVAHPPQVTGLGSSRRQPGPTAPSPSRVSGPRPAPSRVPGLGSSRLGSRVLVRPRSRVSGPRPAPFLPNVVLISIRAGTGPKYRPECANGRNHQGRDLDPRTDPSSAAGRFFPKVVLVSNWDFSGRGARGAGRGAQRAGRERWARGAGWARSRGQGAGGKARGAGARARGAGRAGQGAGRMAGGARARAQGQGAGGQGAGRAARPPALTRPRRAGVQALTGIPRFRRLGAGRVAAGRAAAGRQPRASRRRSAASSGVKSRCGSERSS